MLDIEVRACQALTSAAKRERFKFLVTMRTALARTIGELSCWGVGLDATPMIDRQLVLLEDALLNLVGDIRVAATLSAEWAAFDASLLHTTGYATDWCGVCKHGGLGIGDILETISHVSD